MSNPQLFTLTNNTNANVRVLKIVFDVEPGITPLIDLTQLGGQFNYQQVEFIPPNDQISTIAPGESKSFYLDYAYQTGSSGTKKSNVVVWATGQLTASLKNQITINVGPGPAPSPAPSPSPAPAPSTFKIFDGTGYVNKPGGVVPGAELITIIYESDFAKDFGQSNVQALANATANKIGSTAYVVLDIESPNLWPYTDDATSAANQTLLVNTIRYWKQAQPGHKVGLYGVPPPHLYWPYAVPGGDPSSEAQLPARTAAMQPLADVSDFLAPQCYMREDNSQHCIDLIKNKVATARKYLTGNKPIYPFLWMQYEGGVQFPDDGTFLTKERMRLVLDTVKSVADGLILWGGLISSKNPPIPGPSAPGYYWELDWNVYGGNLPWYSAWQEWISASATQSPSGTTIPTATQIIDNQGGVWTISGGVVYRNAVTAGYSANVVLLLWYNSVIYQKNNAGSWWSWTGSTWSAISGDPRPASGPSPSTVIKSLPPASGKILWEGFVNIPSWFVGMHLHTFPETASYRKPAGEPTYQYGMIRSWNYGDQAPQNPGVAWTNIERSKGVYTWDHADTFFNYHRGKGHRVLYAHGWWTPSFWAQDGQINSKLPPNLTALTAFTKALTLRYYDVIEIMETWNEPNFATDPKYQEGFSGTPEELLSIHKAIWDGVQQAKAQNPAVQVKVSTPAFVDGDPSWSIIKTYVEASYNGIRAKDISDAFSFHLYEYDDGNSGGEDPWPNVYNMRTVLRDYGGFTNWNTIPFYDSEHGFYNSFFQNNAGGDQGRATILKRTGISLAALKTSSVCWYSGDGFGTQNNVLGDTDPTDTRYGLIGYPARVAATRDAINWLHQNLAGKTMVRVERLNDGSLLATFSDGSQVSA